MKISVGDLTLVCGKLSDKAYVDDIALIVQRENNGHYKPYLAVYYYDSPSDTTEKIYLIDSDQLRMGNSEVVKNDK